DGATALTFTLSRLGGADRGTDAFSVEVTFTDGTATGGGVDYASGAQTVAFGAGVNSVDFTVALNDDTLAEGAESFGAALGTFTGPAAAGVGAQSTATGTISASDPFTVQFAAAASAVAENAGNALVTVTRTATVTGAFSVDVTFADETAAGGGVDYTSSKITVAFLSGETSKVVAVPIAEDGEAEAPETLLATLSGVTGGASQGAVGAQATHRVTITDNDPFTVDINARAYAVDEAAGALTVTVDRAGGTGNFTVDVVFAHVNTTAADYTPATQTVTFTNGEMSRTISVPIADDTLAEALEVFTATVANLVDATGQGSLAGDTVAMISINPSDAFAVRFLDAAYAVAEPAGAVAAPLVLRLARTAGVTGAFTVDVAFTGGTATGGADYVATTLTAVFAEGATYANVSVPINPDTLAE
ncbi:hypothetical protein B484DRAFT_410760, partial [Ochromonadaceae sp. CCMP2298]